jgi:hypothetical protein
MTPRKLQRPTYSFGPSKAQEAYEAWGANCGPNALAIMLGVTLDDVRYAIPDFDAKRYTSPSMMSAALKNLWVSFREASPIETWEVSPPRSAIPAASLFPKPLPALITHRFPIYGLARIQWHGPWMKEGVPIAARYRQTHWVGSMVAHVTRVNHDETSTRDELYIFDCNSGWTNFESWASTTVPSLTRDIPRADGEWSVTHRWQLFV